MDMQSLVGQIFQEMEFYETLLFEIEENFEQYFSKAMHFYFERTEDGKIKITEVVHFSGLDEMDKCERSIIEKKEWLSVYETCERLGMQLVRFDRTGWLSIVWNKENTHTQEWGVLWADEIPYEGPMSVEEKRQAFRELAGIFDDTRELQKLGPKKAV